MTALHIDQTSGPDSCWPFMGSRNDSGYGRVWAAGRMIYAHRLSYELANGPIPDGMFVCHRCDNPPCCNPTHLFLGTNRDNLQDMHRKGRGHRATSLNASQVEVARSGRVGVDELARLWGVSARTIYRARRPEYNPAVA